MTGEDVPSPPWGVTATQRNGTRIEVSWNPPMVPNGLIKGYEVFMTPPIPPASYVPHLQSKTFFIIDSEFEANKNYSFWVVAKNKEYESSSSNVATITFDGSVNIDNIEDLKVIDKTNHSVTLAWKKVKNAESYVITPRGPISYPALDSQTTTSNQYTVEGLAPGTRYNFEVCAKAKNYIGKALAIYGMTKDQPLPSVTILEPLLLKTQGTTVKLSWDRPKANRKIKWQYAVHYALNMLDLTKALKIITTNQTVTIRDLEACESYIFAVGVRGDYGAGPLSQPITVTTFFNAKAPPKRPKITRSSENDESVIVLWESSCPTLEEPIGYTVKIIFYFIL